MIVDTIGAEELLAGSSVVHDVTLPPEFAQNAATVRIRPLTVRDFARIAKSTKDDDGLAAAFMIQQALVMPEFTFEQVQRLPAGLARFLVERINEISGVDTPRDALAEYVQAPLAKACFILAREFGWTPEQVSGMTIGQILLYLEMSYRGVRPDATS